MAATLFAFNVFLSMTIGLLSVSPRAATPQTQCPAGSFELGRETVGDEVRVYCGKRKQKEELDGLINAIDTAAKSPGCTGAVSCNFFVGKIAQLRDIPYFRDILTDKSSDGRMANELYGFIEKAVKSRPSGWRAVSEEEAQHLANNGKFVVGVARNTAPSPTNHGHIAIVAPSLDGQLKHDARDGSGPWVRDSQNPNLSIRAGWRFGSSVVKPIYAVWESDR
jgi:hypothetical protein